jgi:sphingomyelin phosphodiesterase acid-like 3
LDVTKVYYNIGNVTNQLLQIFPNTSIFPVLGNHDEHPKDNFPAVNTTYYSDILSVCHWSEILGQVEAEQFKIGTSYLERFVTIDLSHYQYCSKLLFGQAHHL